MIPAPVIWIIFPGLVSLLLYVIRRRERVTLAVGIIVSLLLTLIAWLWPIGEMISLRLWPGMPSWRFEPELYILGRAFVLDNASRPLLMIIYVGICFWLGGAYTARVTRLFTPLGLAIAALLVAALAVRPTLYAALLIEIVALLCIPILSPPGETVARGVIRFLIFQTIGMCLILLGDWWIPAVEIGPSEITRSIQAAAMIGLGFALLEAVFPFHTWVPMLSVQSHPFAFTFVLFILPIAIGLVGLSYLERLAELNIAPIVYNGLRLGGAFLVGISGVWSALQNNLGRILGFAVITQIGLGILTFSLQSQPGYDPLYLGIYFALLLPQGLGLALWGLSLYIIKAEIGDLQFRSVQGVARSLPIAALSLLASNFSITGLPMLASFPVSVIIWSALSEQSLGISLVALVGSACLMIAGLRSMAVLTMNEDNDHVGWQIGENRFQIGLLVLGVFTLFMVGLMPQLFIPPLINMAFIYTTPGP